MSKKNPIATIPEDLREREDLSLGDINRVVELRKRREALEAQITNAEDKLGNLNRDLEQNAREEVQILEATKRADAPAPVL